MSPELALLYQAAGSPLGIVVQVSDFALCQARLYKARRESGDPDLASLQLRRSPFLPEQELWIVKGGQVQVPKDAVNGEALRLEDLFDEESS